VRSRKASGLIAGISVSINNNAKARDVAGSLPRAPKERPKLQTAFPGVSLSQVKTPVRISLSVGMEVRASIAVSTIKCTLSSMPILTSKEREASLLLLTLPLQEVLTTITG
jgi:hypothetical protein